MLYKFGPFILNTREHLLLRDGKRLSITPKAFETLEVLVSSQGGLVARRDLLDKVWPHAPVEEVVLAKNISTLRRILGQSTSGEEYIQTVPKRGYRFIAPVETVTEADIRASQNEHARTRDKETEALAETAPAVNTANGALPYVPGQNLIARPLDVNVKPLSGIPTSRAARSGRVTNQILSKKRSLLLIAVGICAIISLIVLRYKGWGPFQASAVPFERIKISNVTASGNVWAAAVSPDGMYVAYAVTANGQFSLWLKQIDTASQLQLVSPTESQISGLTFSPDGRYIFYLKQEGTAITRLLYRIPMLGGAPQQILRDVDSTVTFSPDGERIAFIRELLAQQSTAIIIASADGTEVETLATRKQPLYYTFDGPAWSPDGKTIACAAGTSGSHMSVVEIRLKDGVEREMTQPLWYVVGKVVWHSSGRSLIISANRDGKFPMQLWRVAYPGGEASQITDGPSSYIGQSLSADSKVLVNIQSDQIADIFIASANDLTRPRRMTLFGGKYNSVTGFSWTPDGKIVYASDTDENCDIWSINADGTGRRQLSRNVGVNIFPTVSPDGKHVAFISERTGSQQIWSMDIDGSNQKQLSKNDPTQNGAKVHLHWSPDSQWVIYTLYSDRPTVWKISINGGPPIQLTTSYSFGGTVSPDGAMISYFSLGDSQKVKLAVVDLCTSRHLADFDIPGSPYGGQLQWAADNSALSYIVNLDGKALLLSQALSGGEPKQLLFLQPGLIEYFAWSFDDTELIYSTSVRTYDVTKVIDLGALERGN